jgi:gamma-glutamyl:cysteine ligase YbdK (ATP-grasp superfamily)
MVDLESGARVATRDRLAQVLDQIQPTSRELGTEDGLNTARALLADNGAERQRYVYATSGARGLVAWLAEETTSSARDLLARRV